MPSEQPSQNWYSLTPRHPYEVKCKAQLSLQLLAAASAEASSPVPQADCQTCSYMQGLATSQRRELSQVEEAKTNFGAIKQLLISHSESGVKAMDAELGELGIGLQPFEPPRALSKQEAQHLFEVNTGLQQT